MQKDIEVRYVDHMGSDMRVCNMARQSFGKWKDESELNSTDVSLLHYLSTGVPSNQRDDYEALYKASTHWTPFAHCQLTVQCTVPIFLARQLVKHQVGIVQSEESRRYMAGNVDYWIPEELHEVPEGSIKQGSGGIHSDNLAMIQTMISHTETAIQNYEYFLSTGMAPEEARMILPLNTMVTFSWTGSLIAMLRVVKQRQDSHAQLAAQEFAAKLKTILQQHFPEATKAYMNYL